MRFCLCVLWSVICGLLLSCQAAPDPLFTTFSIVCRDPKTGDFGVAVTTMPTRVRRHCPFARAGVGAVCTQAWTNRRYGPDGLDHMEKGLSPADAIKKVTEEDRRKNQRQVGMINAEGKPSSFTGDRCIPWCGSVTGKDFAVQGNMLVSEKTVQEAARAFRETMGSLARRMIEALRAGKAAGGDKRGHRSAALIVASKRSGEKPLLIDLTIDDDPKPVEGIAKKFFGECADWFELGDREFGKGDEGADVLILEKRLKMDPADKVFDEKTESALRKWQSRKKLKASGRVDAGTLKKLFPRTY